MQNTYENLVQYPLVVSELKPEYHCWAIIIDGQTIMCYCVLMMMVINSTGANLSNLTKGRRVFNKRYTLLDRELMLMGSSGYTQKFW